MRRSVGHHLILSSIYQTVSEEVFSETQRVGTIKSEGQD
jgi:hypothetical protein